MRWIKPRPWNWQPHLVDPKWRGLTQHLALFAPYWEGAGTPRVWQKNGWVVPTIGGSPTWHHTAAGVGYRSTASGDKVWVPRTGLPDTAPLSGATYTALAAFYYDDLKSSDESGIVMDDGSLPRILELTSTGNVRTFPLGVVTGATAISAPGFHTGASSRDGTSGRIYLDGILDAGPTAISTAVLDGNKFNVSGGANQDWFDGTLLAVYLFNTALSDNQIALWNADPFGLLRPMEETPIVFAASTAGNAMPMAMHYNRMRRAG